MGGKWDKCRARQVRIYGIRSIVDLKHELSCIHYEKLNKLIRYLENKEYGKCKIGKIYLSRKQYKEYLNFDIEMIKSTFIDDYFTFAYLEKIFMRIAKYYFELDIPIFVNADEIIYEL